jgi:hypothetical protein
VDLVRVRNLIILVLKGANRPIELVIVRWRAFEVVRLGMDLAI